MQTTEEFITHMVKIDYIKQAKAFGHYPFQLASVDADAKLTIAALAMNGGVELSYLAAKKIWQKGAVKMFVSIDFPACGDISHDFVGVFTITCNKMECIAIPYDTRTGKQFPQVKQGSTLNILKMQFSNLLF